MSTPISDDDHPRDRLTDHGYRQPVGCLAKRAQHLVGLPLQLLHRRLQRIDLRHVQFQQEAMMRRRTTVHRGDGVRRDRNEDAAKDCDQTSSADHSQITPQITFVQSKRPVNTDQTQHNDPDRNHNGGRKRGGSDPGKTAFCRRNGCSAVTPAALVAPG